MRYFTQNITWLGNSFKWWIESYKQNSDEPLPNSSTLPSRDIEINCQGVEMWDFRLSTEEKNKLYEAGREAVVEYGQLKEKALFNYQKADEVLKKHIKENLIKGCLTQFARNIDYYKIPDKYNEDLKDKIEYLGQSDKNQIEILGMGGAGKSQLALYVAKQYLDAQLRERWKQGVGWKKGYYKKTPLVLVMEAETLDSFRDSLQKLAKELGCDDSNNSNIDVLYGNILEKLTDHFSYLLVFDNVDLKALLPEDRKQIEACLNKALPARPDGTIYGTKLITSQDGNRAKEKLPGRIYVNLDDGLSDEQAKSLVEDLCPHLKGDEHLDLSVNLCKLAII